MSAGIHAYILSRTGLNYIVDSRVELQETERAPAQCVSINLMHVSSYALLSGSESNCSPLSIMGASEADCVVNWKEKWWII